MKDAEKIAKKILRNRERALHRFQGAVRLAILDADSSVPGIFIAVPRCHCLFGPTNIEYNY